MNEKPLGLRIREHLEKNGPQTSREVADALGETPSKIAVVMGDQKRHKWVEPIGERPFRYRFLCHPEVNKWFPTSEARQAAKEQRRIEAQERRKRKGMTAEQRERINANARARTHAKGRRTMEQYRAEQAAARSERMRIEFERLARKSEARQKEREAREAKKEAAAQASARRAAKQRAAKLKAAQDELARLAKKAAKAPKPKLIRDRPASARPLDQQPTVSPAFRQTIKPKAAPAMTTDDFIRQGGNFERIAAAWERKAA